MIHDPDVKTLADLARAQARRHGGRPALTCEDRRVTYAELAALVDRRAGQLRDLGVRPGDRVALLAKERIESVELLLAAAQAGAVLVPINWRLQPVEIAVIAEDAGCRLLFAGPETSAEARAAVARCTVLPLEQPAPASAEPLAPVAVDPHDVAIQVYTSGTTGRPKGAELAHDSFFAIAREFDRHGRRWMGWTADDVIIGAIPLFHIGGLWWLIRGLASGVHNILLPQFVGWQVIEAIERHQVTMGAFVPAMIQMMLSEPDAEPHRFASLKGVLYGGSPISPTLLAQATRAYGCEMFQVYGLTETGNCAVCLTGEDHRAGRKLTSAGRALPGVSLKIIDTDGRELPPFTPGEICIRSPAAMQRYWKNPEATLATLRDGWIHTGDVGHLDDEGYLFVSDRIKDMICCAGEKVYPAEIEHVLAAHPAVREAAVIGVPHPEWGEAIKAVVVLRPDAALTLKELRAFCRGQIADFKLPTSLDLASALPRTPSGKIQKHALRQAYWAAEPRRVG